MKPRPYNLVVLSACRTENTVEENANNTQHLHEMLTALGYQHTLTIGQYKGVRESSFVVKLYPPIEIPFSIIKMLAFSFHHKTRQKSILLVDSQDEASLIYADGSTLPLGRFIEIINPTSQQLSTQNYTQIGDRYFTCRPRKEHVQSSLNQFLDDGYTEEHADHDTYAMYGMDDGPAPTTDHVGAVWGQGPDY